MTNALTIHETARPEDAGVGEPLISVVIATCADAERVLTSVRSVLACAYDAVDIVVVENRPRRSKTRNALREAFPHEPRVRIIDVPRPGLAHARNSGLQAARGEIVAFLDDDVEVDPGWAHAISRAFASTNADCVTGLIAPRSLESEEQILFEQLAVLDKGDSPRLFRLGEATRDGHLFPYAAGIFGSGANIAVRTAVARKLGGFDVVLGAGTRAGGGEDLDFFVRLILGGHAIYYEPAAVVAHEHPSDRAALRIRAFKYGLGLSAMLMGQFVRGPRVRLARALPAGLSYARDPASRKNAGRDPRYPRELRALEWLGMLIGPVAWLWSAFSARHQAAAAAIDGEGDGFKPTATRTLDLEQPLADLELGRSQDGSPYGSLLALVRLHGEPLGATEVALQDGCARSSDIADHVWRELRPAIAAHIRKHACVPIAAPTRAAIATGLRGACSVAAVSTTEAPFITVIVPTANRPARIRPCIESLSSLNYPNYEILVVDNAPDDERTRDEVEAAVATGAALRYVAEPLPGSSVARNRGVRETTAEIVAFTDDDVAVDPDWLSWMVKPFLEDANVGVVTGLVMPARFDTPEQRWFEQLAGFGKGFERKRYHGDSDPVPQRFLYPYWGAVFGSGNSMAFRRSVLEAIGGLDPALGAGSPARAGADIESFSHALLRGSALVYEPRAVCWHDHRTSERALARQTFNYGVGCTAIFTKWALRDPRLVRLAVRQSASLLKRTLLHRGAPQDMPHELRRLHDQLAANRTKGNLARQFAGFAVGPLLYARSVIWARRLRLRDVLPERSARRA